MLNRIQLRPTSIEKEVFPAMAADGQLFAQPLEGFWMDIGQPRDYLIGMRLFLNDSAAYEGSRSLTEGQSKNKPTVVGSVLVHPSATFGTGCVIGPDVILGANVRLGNDVRIKISTLMDGTVVGDGGRISGCIVGWRSQLGKDVCLGRAVLAEGVAVDAGAVILETKLSMQDLKSSSSSSAAAATTTPSFASRFTSHKDYLEACDQILGAVFPPANNAVAALVHDYLQAKDVNKPGRDDYPESMIRSIRSMNSSKGNARKKRRRHGGKKK